MPDTYEGLDIPGGLPATSEGDSIRIEEAVEPADAWADAAMNRLVERGPAAVGTVAGVPVGVPWIQGDRTGPVTHEVAAASVHDSADGKQALTELAAAHTSVTKVWADSGYQAGVIQHGAGLGIESRWCSDRE